MLAFALVALLAAPRTIGNMETGAHVRVTTSALTVDGTLLSVQDGGVLVRAGQADLFVPSTEVISIVVVPPPPPPPVVPALPEVSLPSTEEMIASLQAGAALDPASDGGSGRRTLGFVLLGVGLAAGVSAGVCLYLESAKYGDIQGGGFRTSADIESALSTAHVEDTVAIGLGIGGAVLAAVGLPLVLVRTSADGSRISLAAKSGSRFQGLVLTATVP